jgi:hypothetical protein
MHVYKVRPRNGQRGVDLISDTLPFGRLWYAGANAASKATHAPRKNFFRLYRQTLKKIGSFLA